MVQATAYVDSYLDGQDSGGFILMNVDSPMQSAYQVLDDEQGGYYQTLDEARAACRRLRNESGNNRIYVYALAGVRHAIEQRPSDYDIE